ncbi:MAG: P-II family nitrogen regulator [Acutalibacteraceae bacterium]|jgi:nitrogen regulatory protein PII
MDTQIKEQPVKQPFLMLTLILSEHQCNKFAHLIKEKDIRKGIILIGRGTVKNATLNLIGIKSQKKEIVSLLLEKEKANELLDFFTREFQLKKPGHGIAYTTPVIIAGQTNKQDTQNKELVLGGEGMYKKLTVVVNRGMAEDVMDIALKSGVKGGTILHGRGTGTEFTKKVFGMEIEPEKELVMILMPDELVEKVIDDLHKELKLDIPGNGILFVEPVLEVRGLSDLQNIKKDTE